MLNRDDFTLIRIYGDSLAMPREFDGIPFYLTYPELVKRDCAKDTCLFNRSRGGATVKSLWYDYQQDQSYFSTKGDLLIIQCGIVDCAPRPIPTGLSRFLMKMPKRVQGHVRDFLHKHRPQMLSAGFSFRHLMPDEFTHALFWWLAGAQRDFKKVCVINIAPTNEQTEKHSPGLSESISQYNRIIETEINKARWHNVRLIDVHSAISRDIPKYINEKDGHHITVEGHELYARLINEAI
ncbi:MAG: SGNH/GDSL hydrolase family protein [Syntrophorhabdaceae bacterium]